MCERSIWVRIESAILYLQLYSTYVPCAAATRGTGVEGAVPADTLVIFAIGG
jgi:hypothetical protein